RNPLTGIAGFAALLKRDLADDDPCQKLVSNITRGVETLDQTVTSLLNYTRFEEISAEMVRYDEFLRHTVEQFRYDHSALCRKVRFDLRSPFGSSPPPISLSCDPMLLRRLFYNLFTNAIEAHSGEPTIEVTFRKLPRQKAIQLYSTRMILSVQETVTETVICDNGPGLPEESEKQLFAPFFTTKPEGNGLGLAIAWKIIKAHGGDILADNNPGGGARFTILLPTRIEAARTITEPATE
ncbi:MAG: ATP-binding protein, partial [candidate division Zixibacteria bacterium]